MTYSLLNGYARPPSLRSGVSGRGYDALAQTWFAGTEYYSFHFRSITEAT